MHLQEVFLSVLLPASVVLAQQPVSIWGQCGGIGWAGATTCAAGSVCVVSNPYYSQCLPGVATTSTTIITSITKTTTTIITTTLPPTGTTTKPPSTTITGGGTGPGTTLLPNYYWIRAVESPNFHSYLQTSPTDAPGIALLTSYLTAGQFQILSNGQFVETINAAGTELLYANVGQPANATVSILPVSFTTTPNTFGTFAFQGDAVTWSVPSISRPNTAAWYVCGDQQLFINLGNYDYLTPAGCADETIHYYNGATTVD